MSENKRLKSFYYAFRGLKMLVSSQPNARFHLVATMLVIAASIYFKLSPQEWLAVTLAMALVWALEAINTAVEFLADATTDGWDPTIGQAKDVAAAAVLLAALGALVVGLIVFLPKLLRWLSW